MTALNEPSSAIEPQLGLGQTDDGSAAQADLSGPKMQQVRSVSSLASYRPSAEFIEKVPIAFARQHRLLGLAGGEDRLLVAVADLLSLEQLQVLARFLGRDTMPLLAPAEQILSATNQAYQQRSGEAQSLIQKMEGVQGEQRDEVLNQLQELASHEDLLDVASRAPVIKLVNLILFEAVKQGASDVHIQPDEQSLGVRMRIDGILYDSFMVPKAIQEEVISRIKIMGRMNIAEKRLAQDGRATVQVGDRVIDLRIATLPTSFGERVVLRLLDKSIRMYRLSELGMDGAILALFRGLIGLEHGIILVTGPTGSGKTTTLYAALEEINRKELNILTLEDPIEYQLQGVSQTQVSEKKGMTFAGALRNVLRQDPDIILVGEIRDRETAVMAIQSALTGHLVFSTLHTNDAASAITRLLDLGIEPYLLASSLVGVLAQRLVRKICAHCGSAYFPDEADLARVGLESQRQDLSGLRLGQGCPHCRHSGYAGRLGIFELLRVNEPIRRKIQSCASASEVAIAALEAGMKSLREDGVAKVLTGMTTIDEVLRVTMRTKT